VLKRIKERQEAAITEGERIQQTALQNKNWERPLLSTLGDLGRTQEELGQETRSVAEHKLAGAKVFARLLSKAADAMTQAGRGFEERLKSAQEHPEQLTADARTPKLQRDALRRLDQLLDAIKTEKGAGRAQAQSGEGGGGGQGGGGPRGNADDIPDIAQLKVLRSLQQEINERTESFGKQHPNRAKLNDDEKRELDSLSKEQKEVGELLDEITKPSGSEGGDK